MSASTGDRRNRTESYLLYFYTLHFQVAPSSKIDKLYDTRMSKLTAERDKKEDVQESLVGFPSDQAKQSVIYQRFLAEGLDKKAVSLIDVLINIDEWLVN